LVAAYPIKTKGSATFSDSPIGADRMRIANERAMHQNIAQFILALSPRRCEESHWCTAQRIAGRPADYASSNIPAPPEVPPQRDPRR
jgi:hypothetical protein